MAELRKFLLEEAEGAKGLKVFKKGMENLLDKKPPVGFFRSTYSPIKKKEKKKFQKITQTNKREMPEPQDPGRVLWGKYLYMSDQFSRAPLDSCYPAA